MLVEAIPAQVLATNCWVVAEADGESCVLVDPGGGLDDRLDRFVEAHRLTPSAVLITHGHFDHTMSAADVCRQYGVPAYVHASDRAQLADPWSGIGMPTGSAVPGLPTLRPVEPDVVTELLGAERLQLGGLTVSVTSVPGHTPGSVIYSVEADGGRAMFTGDFLFAGSIGRMDLPGGSEEDMAESLREAVLSAPADAVVNPGHGPASSIGRELSSNPYLKDLT